MTLGIRTAPSRSTRLITPSSSPSGAPPCAYADTRICWSGSGPVPSCSTVAVIGVPPGLGIYCTSEESSVESLVRRRDDRSEAPGHVSLRLERHRHQGRGRQGNTGPRHEGPLDG